MDNERDFDDDAMLEVDYDKYYNENIKPKKKMPVPFFIIGILAITAILVLVAIIIERNTPSNDYVNLHEYYGIDNEQLVVIYNGNVWEAAVFEEDVAYINYDFIREKFTDRFYYDESLQAILYTTATEIYEISTDSKNYSVDGEIFTEDYVIAVENQGELFIAADFLMDRGEFSFELIDNPNRLIIFPNGMEVDEFQFAEGVKVRTECSIKADIIGDAHGEKYWIDTYAAEVDGWIAVANLDGRKGYVKVSDLPENTVAKVFESENDIPEYTTCHKDYDIVLVWHAVYKTEANSDIAGLLESTKGVTTVSPTWYKVADETGEITSMADKSYVDYIHSLGMEIWPLISDFTSVENEGWNVSELYSNAKNRRRLIDNIISEAVNYGYDGINIDFEHVSAEAADGYTQFIRELSVECRQRDIVLSVDNYVPMSHNLHYNRAAQGECVDYVIVMGYDEHYSGGEEAGSVASIDFVRKGILDTRREGVPSDKLINALPFYTRLWKKTVNEDKEEELTSVSYSMYSAEAKIEELGLDKEWDDEVMQYVAKGRVDGTYYSIWLEEEKSLAAKMELVRENKLAGIAAWSLGMEKDSVWDILVE